MSTTDYLDQRDYDQLIFARDRAEFLIKQKESESRVPLYVISDDCVNYAAFTEDQFSAGVERLCAEIVKYAEKYPGQELLFEMRRILYRASEVEDMLKL